MTSANGRRPRATKSARADQDALVAAALRAAAERWRGGLPQPVERVPFEPMRVVIPVREATNGRRRPNPNQGIAFGPGKHGPPKKVKTIKPRPMGQR